MTLYEIVTRRILNQLASGVVPWRKTWTNGLPRSLTTGRDYRGINILVLGSTAFASRYWVTYREAQRLGGHVRKGERATPVVYWKTCSALHVFQYVVKQKMWCEGRRAQCSLGHLPRPHHILFGVHSVLRKPKTPFSAARF